MLAKRSRVPGGRALTLAAPHRLGKQASGASGAGAGGGARAASPDSWCRLLKCLVGRCLSTPSQGRKANCVRATSPAMMATGLPGMQQPMAANASTSKLPGAATKFSQAGTPPKTIYGPWLAASSWLQCWQAVSTGQRPNTLSPHSPCQPAHPRHLGQALHEGSPQTSTSGKAYVRLRSRSGPGEVLLPL